MEGGALYLLAADTILFVHAAFVAFVVFGLFFILIGKFCAWAWIRNPWFRWAHVAGIGVVVLQSWLGVICPLTTWEMSLREKAGDAVYSGAFIAHWLESIMYYRFPQWVFVAGYTAFGALVAASWLWVRPRRFVRSGVNQALMNKTLLIAITIMFVALAAIAFFFRSENRMLSAEIGALSDRLTELHADNERLQGRLEDLQSDLVEVRAAGELARAACDTRFAGGLYRLVTSTNYGPNAGGEYEIYHVSVLLSEWRINAGMTLNAFGIPTDFYLDYDGDGRLDTPLAARLVREIPVVGNTIADRLLADSRVHQNLYAVFSCEWRNAEYTSAEDLNETVTGTSKMLWDLVQQHSASIAEWIRSP